MARGCYVASIRLYTFFFSLHNLLNVPGQNAKKKNWDVKEISHLTGSCVIFPFVKLENKYFRTLQHNADVLKYLRLSQSSVSLQPSWYGTFTLAHAGEPSLR
jgi:hypothetical protein